MKGEIPVDEKSRFELISQSKAARTEAEKELGFKVPEPVFQRVFWYSLNKISRYDNHLEGLQKRHFQTYLDGIRDTLFEQFETLSVRNGPWMSKQISRKEHVA